MVEEKWTDGAEAYRRYCDIETDVSNKIHVQWNIQYFLFQIIKKKCM